MERDRSGQKNTSEKNPTKLPFPLAARLFLGVLVTTPFLAACDLNPLTVFKSPVGCHSEPSTWGSSTPEWAKYKDKDTNPYISPLHTNKDGLALEVKLNSMGRYSYDSNGQILLNRRNQEQKVISSESLFKEQGNYSDHYPIWLDDNRIMFIRAPIEGPAAIKIVNRDGSDLKTFTEVKHDLSDFVISKDKTKVAYGTEKGIYAKNIYVPVEVKISSDPNDDPSSWSKDGAKLAFVRNGDRGTSWEIGIAKIDGSKEKILTHTGDDERYGSPNWSYVDGKEEMIALKLTRGATAKETWVNTKYVRINLDNGSSEELCDAGTYGKPKTW